MLESFNELFTNLPIDVEFWFWFIAIASVVSILFALLVIPILLCLLPEDYFVSEKRVPLHDLSHQRKLSTTLLAFVKNIIGIVLIITGLIMLFTPGQGGLTILAGLILVNFPGKYKLERKLMKQDKIYRSINWLRAMMGKADFIRPN